MPNSVLGQWRPNLDILAAVALRGYSSIALSDVDGALERLGVSTKEVLKLALASYFQITQGATCTCKERCSLNAVQESAPGNMRRE